MTVPQVVVIADDLTGAADTGVAFARAGLTTLVYLQPGPFVPADVLVLSTHSRHLTRSEAAGLAGQAAERTRRVSPGRGPAWIYKKVDSTMRGHPGAELAAVMGALGVDRALVAPAFPEQGRTTVNGRQLVGGRPLDATPFGACFGQASRPGRCGWSIWGRCDVACVPWRCRRMRYSSPTPRRRRT